ncbi:MAG: OmpA family protein [Clostridiales bacterium]|nr:OmpA family protein [Clostridiales bacterium]
MSNYKSVTLAEEPFYIFFENESAEIKDSQMFVLDKAVFDTKNNAGKLLYITGNSSLRNKGKYASPEGEHELALLRARKIADYFIENSVPESQIIIMENGSLNFSFSGNKDHVELYIK